MTRVMLGIDGDGNITQETALLCMRMDDSKLGLYTTKSTCDVIIVCSEISLGQGEGIRA